MTLNGVGIIILPLCRIRDWQLYNHNKAALFIAGVISIALNKMAFAIVLSPNSLRGNFIKVYPHKYKFSVSMSRGKP